MCTPQSFTKVLLPPIADDTRRRLLCWHVAVSDPLFALVTFYEHKVNPAPRKAQGLLTPLPLRQCAHHFHHPRTRPQTMTMIGGLG